MRDITDLRESLFDVIEKVKSGKIDAKDAKVISDTAQTIINSAKVEVDHANKVGGRGSGFIPESPRPQLSQTK